VALLSPEHEERIRKYLKLDSAQMAEELTRVRVALAKRESRPPTHLDYEQPER